MMQKHMDALQQEKENQAMSRMVALLPHMGVATKAHALREANFDVEEATRMLLEFESHYLPRLEPIYKVSSRQPPKYAATSSGSKC